MSYYIAPLRGFGGNGGGLEYTCAGTDVVMVPADAPLDQYCDSSCPEDWFLCDEGTGSPLCIEPQVYGIPTPPGCSVSTGEEIGNETEPTESSTTATESTSSTDTNEQITAVPPAPTPAPAPAPEPEKKTPTWVYFAAGGSILVIAAAFLR
jgi:hypothetical protein